MNIGMTLLLQGIGFFIFLFVVYKFVLPPLADAVEGRRRQIADGLAEAEKGKASLATAQKEVDKIIAEAKAKGDAKAAGEREKQMAADEIAQLSVKAKEELRDRVADLAVAGAQRILAREINPQVHAELLGQLKAEL